MTAKITLAFDVYGTLIDTNGVTAKLRDFVGDDAPAVARAWRDKQLEYAFRRGLMRRYVTFAECTRQALEYVCAARGGDVGEEQRRELLAVYRQLPAFADAAAGLAAAKARGWHLRAFSNGEAAAVEALLAAAGLRGFFDGIVSVDAVKSFKPDAAVYAHFLRECGADAGNIWLVSANPFDVLGALAAGWRAAWLRRDAAAVFDPWDMAPTATVQNLADLPAAIENAYSAAGVL